MKISATKKEIKNVIRKFEKLIDSKVTGLKWHKEYEEDE